MSSGHLILVGLPGAGKTTVGPLIAAELGVEFVDVDTLIEERIGTPVATIFEDQGEEAFRAHERAFVADLVSGEAPMVIAPGGGWVVQDKILESVAGLALTVYLEATPATAAVRARNGAVRPLLGPDTARWEERIGELYQQRRRYYSACDLTVVTDGLSAAQVARQVAELARNHEGS